MADSAGETAPQEAITAGPGARAATRLPAHRGRRWRAAGGGGDHRAGVGQLAVVRVVRQPVEQHRHHRDRRPRLVTRSAPLGERRADGHLLPDRRPRDQARGHQRSSRRSPGGGPAGGRSRGWHGGTCAAVPGHRRRHRGQGLGRADGHRHRLGRGSARVGRQRRARHAARLPAGPRRGRRHRRHRGDRGLLLRGRLVRLADGCRCVVGAHLGGAPLGRLADIGVRGAGCHDVVRPARGRGARWCPVRPSIWSTPRSWPT